MILFFNVRECESHMSPGSAGTSPDSMQRHTACNMKTLRNATGNMPAAAGRMPALPELL
jgi:hypothetical protein